MFLRLKILFFKNGEVIPFLEIEGDNLIIDLKYELQKDNVYILNFEYGCLENNSIINIINNIFTNYNLNYIDKYLWEQFLEDKYSEEKKRNNVVNIITPVSPSIVYDNNNNTINEHKTKIKLDNLEYLWYCSESLNNCYKILCYETKFDSDESYAVSLLNLIFNCDIDLKIKKCEMCNKPFITHTINTKKCHRVYKNEITCNQYAEKVRKKHQYDDPIKHLIKNVRDKFKNDEDKLNEFNEKLPIKKEQYFNDNKSFINWILNDYYYTDEGRKKIIERLNLSKYL